MITRQQIEALIAFQNGEFLVTSCYLDLDRSKMPAQMVKIRVKDLLHTAHHQLAEKTGSHSQRESLRQDFDFIEQEVMPEIAANRYKGQVIFSCAGEKFHQSYGLPRLVRNILVADKIPYIRPLTSILAEYHRFCVVVVDRHHGEIYEVYMHEIFARTDVIDRVPRRVNKGGLGGREERRIERRCDQAVQNHYRNIAGKVRHLFQQDKFDWLILGGQREPLIEFKNFLHPSLRTRWAGDFHAQPSKTPVLEILQNALDIEARVETEHEVRLVEQLIQQADAGHRAVKGIGATLLALDSGEAQTLLVEEGFAMPGYACFDCHFASLEPVECPHCHRPTGPCADIVDEAIELALHRNCQIEHLQGATPLRDGGRIGALLRYQTAWDRGAYTATGF